MFVFQCCVARVAASCVLVSFFVDILVLDRSAKRCSLLDHTNLRVRVQLACSSFFWWSVILIVIAACTLHYGAGVRESSGASTSICAPSPVLRKDQASAASFASAVCEVAAR